jgi:hypothetical protein
MKKLSILFTLVCLISSMGICQSIKKVSNKNNVITQKESKNDPFSQLKTELFSNNSKSFQLKQDSVIRQYYDTINEIWYNNVKAEMSYNEFGLNTQVSYFSWNNNLNVWQKSENEEIAWNLLGLISQRIKKNWDNGLNQWVKVDTQSIIYNGNNDIIQINQWSWDALLNQWANSGHIITTYNPNNQITQITESAWDSGNSNWKTTDLYQKEYDNNSNLVSDLRIAWNYSQNQMDTIYWDKYEFNIFNKVAKQEHYSSSNQNNNLKLDATYYYKYDLNQLLYCDSTIVETIPNNMININLHFYDTNNRKIQTINQNWEWIGGFMSNSVKTDYSYNSTGKEILNEVYYWDENMWKIALKTETNYDINGNQISLTDYIYDSSEIIESGEEVLVAYDLNYMNSQIEMHYPVYNDGFFIQNGSTNRMDSITWATHNVGQGTWDYSFKNRYYYSGFGPDGIQKNENTLLSVYPNPATDYILVDSKDLSTNASIVIYDTFGRMVINQPIKGKVSVKDLSNGIYYYTINNNGKVATGKVIVE